MCLKGSEASTQRRAMPGRRAAVLALVLAAFAWGSLRDAQAAMPTRTAAPVVITDCTNDTQLRSALLAVGTWEITFNCGPGSHTIPVGAYMQVAGDASVDGANRITLDGGGTAALLQVFNTASLTLRNITLANGAFNGAHPIENFGELALDNVEVRAMVSATGSGGALGNQGGHVTVQDSRFLSNTAAIGPIFGSDGGAIWNNGGVVEVSDSLFERNNATSNSRQGGAIANLNAGHLRVSGSTFRQNLAYSGGALYVASGTFVTITESSFISNTADFGGAIDSGGKTEIHESVLRGNATTMGGGGAIRVAGGEMEVTYTTIAGNRSNSTGGGVTCSLATLFITHSTISGNRAGASGANSHGGGIYSNCELNLSNSTVSDNQAPAALGGGVYQTGNGNSATIGAATIAGNHTPAAGGGVYNEGSSTTSVLTLQQTLLVSNTVGNCDGGGISSLGYNLSGDTNCAALTQTGDQQNIALPLGPLAGNGGPTWTRLLLPGSPAIDAIPAASCGGFTLDQRGVTRPQNTACDVGAVEMQAVDLEGEVFIPVAFE